MASLQIILIFSCGWWAIAAQDGLIFPSGRNSRVGLAAGVALPVNLTDAISRGSEAFSLDLFQQLCRAVTPDKFDFIISPFSIWSLLVLLAEGAAGTTYTQLSRILRLPVDLTEIRTVYKYMDAALMINNSAVQLSTSQVLFSDANRPIELDFQYKLEHVYEADYQAVNFANPHETYDKINGYVKKKTGGRINEIVQLNELNQAQMILISVIFFQGRWKYPFKSEDTRPLPFHDEYGTFVSTVQMMFRHGGCSYVTIPGLQSNVLHLPYGDDNRLYMIVILPEQNVPLVTVTDSLRVFGMDYVLNEMMKAEEDPDLEVFLPRFSLSTDFKMNDILERMGLVDIFDEKKSNLSNISKHLVYVSNIVHKAVIEVNEEGTVATAATGATLTFNSISAQFYVNRPFVFLILEKTTNSILFCGQIRNPGNA